MSGDASAQDLDLRPKPRDQKNRVADIRMEIDGRFVCIAETLEILPAQRKQFRRLLTGIGKRRFLKARRLRDSRLRPRADCRQNPARFSRPSASGADRRAPFRTNIREGNHAPVRPRGPERFGGSDELSELPPAENAAS
jgi:hypothetical protein